MDSDTLGVDGSEVGVLEQRDKVGFRSFLKCHDRRGLEAKIRLHTKVRTTRWTEVVIETNLEVLRNFTNKTLEGKLADEELRRLLVPTDLTKSDGTRPEAVGLLNTSGRCLTCQLVKERLNDSKEDG